MPERCLSPLLTLTVLSLALHNASQAAEPQARNFTVSAQAAGQATQQRVALVMGNNAYSDAPLSNPVNDARAVAKALESAGFKVLLKLNANHKEMLGAVREFGSQLRQGGSGVFYFAGHGMQIKGRNYLIPVGADIQREDEVAYQAMDAQAVLDKMDSAGNGTNLMILDACRNNPFARSFRSATQGLAQMEAPVGTLVAFATAPGSVSSDGEGSHGLYTEHLLRLMQQPGMKVEDIFKQVRVGVRKASQGKQIPWESTSLEGDFYFVPPSVQAAAPTPAPAPAATASQGLDQAFWEAVRQSSTPADLQAYLTRFPEGRHRDEAQRRLADLTRPGPSAAASLAPAPAPVAQVAAPPPAPARPVPQQASTDINLALPAASQRLAVGLPLAPPAVPKPQEDSLPVASPRVAVGRQDELLVRPQASPASTVALAPASTSRGYAVGDRWNFQTVDKWRGEVVRNFSIQVKQLRADGSWTTPGGVVYDPMAQLQELPASASQAKTTFTPAQPRWWEGIKTGDRREFRYRIEVANADGTPTIREVVAKAVVKGKEKVKVPAGEFEALRIELDSSVDSSKGSQRWANQWAHTYWYVPELRFHAAMDFESRNDRGMLEKREREELTSYEQRIGALAQR